MNVLKSLAKNSFFASISEASIGFLFLLYILAARYLGDAQFGIFSFALAFVSIFGVLNDLGLRYVYLREVAREREEAERYFGNVVVMQLGFSAASLFLMVVTVNLLPGVSEFNRMVVYILAGAELLRMAKYLFRFVFRALDQFNLESVTVVLERIALLIAGFAVLWAGGDVILFALTFLLVRIVDVAITFVLVAKNTVRPSFRFEFALWRYLIGKALPFALSGIVLLLFFRVSTVLLSLFRTDAEVGWYSAAYKLIEGMILVPAIFSSSLYPVIAKSHKDLNIVVSLYRRGVKYLFLAAIPITIIGFILSEQIILFIYGAEYENSVIILRLALFGIAFIYVREVGSTVLAAVDRQRQSFAIAAIVLVINVIANAILIPRHGYVGAAIATVSAEFIYGLLIAGYLYRLKYRVPYLRLMIKPLIAGVTVAALAAVLRLPVLICLVGAVVGYLLIITLLSVWDDEELVLFGRFFRSARKKLILGYKKISN